MKTMYLDNAATTPLLPEVKQKMAEAMEYFANPATLYSAGQNARWLVDNARKEIADYIGCAPSELVMTSGGSESDNMALSSIFDMSCKRGNHIITTKIEHKAVLNTCRYLEEYRGAKVTYLDVDSKGRIDLNELQEAITPETVLMSIMHVNNEIGTIQPMASISAIARERGILFHTDNVQGFCHAPLDISLVDLMSVSAHKFGGPKGIGFLYVRNGIDIPPYIHGGHQEGGRRAGTTNTLGILGMSEAVKQWAENGDIWNKQISNLSMELRERLLTEIPGVSLNGPEFPRAKNNTNVSFDGVRGEELQVLLDIAHICVSTGSACNSSDHSPSHVLKAIGLSDEQADSSIRFSLSHTNTLEEIDYTVDKVKFYVDQLRSR